MFQAKIECHMPDDVRTEETERDPKSNNNIKKLKTSKNTSISTKHISFFFLVHVFREGRMWRRNGMGEGREEEACTFQ